MGLISTSELHISKGLRMKQKARIWREINWLYRRGWGTEVMLKLLETSKSGTLLLLINQRDKERKIRLVRAGAEKGRLPDLSVILEVYNSCYTWDTKMWREQRDKCPDLFLFQSLTGSSRLEPWGWGNLGQILWGTEPGREGRGWIWRRTSEE